MRGGIIRYFPPQPLAFQLVAEAHPGFAWSDDAAARLAGGETVIK
jgi:hypothetical protein